MKVGLVLGTINTFILLTVVYIVMLPFLRVYWALRGSDVLYKRQFQAESAWMPIEGATKPNADDLSHQF